MRVFICCALGVLVGYATAQAQTVRVDPTILTVPRETNLRWSDGSPRQIAALRDQRGQTTLLYEASVLVEPASDRQLEDVLERLNASVERTNEVPQKLLENNPERARQLRARPKRYTLHVDTTRLPAAEALQRELASAGRRDVLSLSSESAVRLLAAVAQERRRGIKIAARFVAEDDRIPSTSTTELAGLDGFTMPAYASTGAKSDVIRAWQFFQAGNISGSVNVAIVDHGFYVQPDGQGIADASGTSDISPIFTWNVDRQNTDVSGTGLVGTPWHGTGTTSVAGAPLNNGAGSAGVGGLVAALMLVSYDGSTDEMADAVRISWLSGAAVINISQGASFGDVARFYGSVIGDLDFGVYQPMSFVEAIEEADHAGVLVVVSAGNANQDSLDNDVMPCSRTAAFCVGATNATDNLKASYSNFGSSVWIWAPGTITTMPDGNSGGQLRPFNGTSAAAPFISGVAAMMKAVDPTLTAPRLRDIIMQTAWTDSPDSLVTRYVNAYAAVREAAKYTLPPDRLDALSDNGTSATASIDIPVPPLITSSADLSIANKADSDWLGFTSPGFTPAILAIEYLPTLGPVMLGPIYPVGDSLPPDVSAPTVQTLPNGRVRVTRNIALLAPDTYVFPVNAPEPNAYDVSLVIAGATSLAPDPYEPNDGIAQATPFACDRQIRANLQPVTDVDFYRLTLPKPGNPNRIPFYTLYLTGSDVPVNVWVQDISGRAAGAIVDAHTGLLSLQPGDYIVRVNSARSEIGRYILDCSLRVLDPSARGGPLERVPVRPINPGDPFGDQYLHGEVDRWIFVADAGLQTLTVRGTGISARLLTAQGRPANIAPRTAGERSKPEVSFDLRSARAGGRYVVEVSRLPSPAGAPPKLLPLPVSLGLR